LKSKNPFIFDWLDLSDWRPLLKNAGEWKTRNGGNNTNWVWILRGAGIVFGGGGGEVRLRLGLSSHEVNGNPETLLIWLSFM